MNNKQQPMNLKKTALLSALLLELAGSVSAATINVDGTICTLSDAIVAANNDVTFGGCTAGTGDDVLELDIAGSPFTQTEPVQPILSSITINGNGSAL